MVALVSPKLRDEVKKAERLMFHARVFLRALSCTSAFRIQAIGTLDMRVANYLMKKGKDSLEGVVYENLGCIVKAAAAPSHTHTTFSHPCNCVVSL